MARSSSVSLKVPSSLAARFKGTLAAPGMWPPRNAPSWGYSGMGRVVPGDGVLEVGVPVDLDRSGDVPAVVQPDVLVGLDDHEARIVCVLGEPLGRDQLVRVGVALQLLGGVGSYGRHGFLLGSRFQV